jgi:hypothetical protein
MSEGGVKPSTALAAALAAGVVCAGAGFAGGWYASARRAPRPAVMRDVTEDRNHDGRPDRWVERDARGRPAKVRDDRDYDGFPERTEIYVDGRLNRVDYDSDHDRLYDSTDQLGSHGGVLFVMTDRNWNTVPERWVHLNARGQISSEWIDADEDSAPERSRTFDAAGRLTEEGIDADGDGLFEELRTFNTRWPAGSGPLRIERDEDRDGVNERRESYTVTGLLRSSNDDTDGDGVRDHISLFRPDGFLRKEGYDRDGDGFFESWRFPVAGAPSRAGYDDDEDYDIDRWDPPGAPERWCAARCAVGPSGDGGVSPGAAPVR